MTRRSNRPGTSLLEVLVGLGILAVGAISAFVLFPLSAINVSRALIDDRSTTCAVTADGQLRDIHRQYVVAPETNGVASNEQYHKAMDNGMSGAPLAPNDAGPSYPVAVDPMGFVARSPATGQNAIGDSGQTQLPRVNLNIITSNSLALRFCSQMDGLTFGENGDVPSTTNTAEMRELRYNWMWVLQRPVNRDRHTVRMQVVVFDRRVHMYAPPKSEDVHGGVTFTPGDTMITGVPLSAEVRKGTWIMDATIDPARGLRHAEFYRVVSVTEGANSYTLEVNRPVVRADGLTSFVTPNPYAYTGNLVVMPAVVEVFERPMLTGGFGP